MIRNAPIALVLMLTAGPALAAEPPADAPTATAAAKDDPGAAAQIAAFLADSPVAQLPTAGGPAAAPGPGAPRGPHGVVEVAVGNHGYRSVYLESHMPLGENGMLSIAVGDQRGGYGGYGGYYGGYGGYGARLAPEPGRLEAGREIEARTPEPSR